MERKKAVSHKGLCHFQLQTFQKADLFCIELALAAQLPPSEVFDKIVNSKIVRLYIN